MAAGPAATVPGRRRIALIGTGGLARAVACSLAVVCRAPLDVAVVGRRAERARQVCYLAATRAACGGATGLRFTPGTTLADAVDGADGVLVLASEHSPWEAARAPSAWTALLTRAGFGLTLPFQAEPARRVARLLAGRTPRPWLLNGCFPDAVNPLLAALGLPVLAGIGNIALLAASAQAALGLPGQSRLHMLAHHVHLHAPAAEADDVRLWLDGAALPAPGRLLAEQRAAERQELNQVTGHAAALLVAAMAAGAPVDTHLPGPHGLPGGYPVRVHGSEVRLRLPAGLDRAAAVAFNQRAAAADGVVLDGDRVRFGPRAAAELDRVAPALSGGFPIGDLDAARAELHVLRERLRGRPADRLPGTPV
ncbi:potassium transporter TrkA [Allonocardiopsis opalescens]|uniref:Potassium transporter TrkA n=1 Tax=Allonocardiopsis opalescens TaxID=1144618 RepID=A0A2T0PYG1_9ACTN|nr:potassium transporter TrkA [Allonocardiopsis opalescens]PRX96573.1 hypothetical protein CLV72_10796 [Allonocardiopsis opalescens]